ncbi:MAG TPA: cytochrome b [Solirubrobacterales bacterium]|nr:cytochrome b [Solirubrobacterales bacterium]
MIRRVSNVVEDRAGGASFMRAALRYVFPDHWSFLLGEIALYSFVVLVATGTFLALFYSPSNAVTVYHGGYAPLAGQEMTKAYASGLSLSFDVPAGLLMRQTHHWAALVFVAAITMHLLRIFFTGAFRKPRDVNYYVGLTMLIIAVLEGYLGYSLLDDLLSGMGLAIGYSAALSIPIVGAHLATLIWNGPFPGTDAFFSRMFIAHVFILPAVLAALIGFHLAMIARPHHTQFAGPGRTERNVVGIPMWPGYALRSVGLLLAVAGVLFMMGGLIQINPIWLWGPYHTYQATNGAQPDWYLGWLIGALRLVPSFDVTIGDYTLIPNPFWGGILFPTLVFGFLYAWPAIERRRTGDHAQHNLLDRPRDAPSRTAVGAAVFTFVATVFFAGSADRAFVQIGVGYEIQVWIYRALTLVLPFVAYWVTRRVCEELRARELALGTASPIRRIRRGPGGGFTAPGA